MQLYIQTEVKASLPIVIKGFTEELFLKLNPPLPPVRLLRFDGSSKGDIVKLELNFLFFKNIWESHITENGETANQWWFVDEGVHLPFFLKKWKHRHILLANSEGGTNIIDDIEYSTGNIFYDRLLYPAMYGQFLYRKPIYKKIFHQSFK